MNFLFLYKYLRALAANASTNRTNRTNLCRPIPLFQFVQLVLSASGCACYCAGDKSVRARGSSHERSRKGNSRRAPELASHLSKGVKCHG